MAFEDEIKQGKVLSENQKTIANLILTYNFVSTRLQTFLDEFGLTNQQYNILRILRGQYPHHITNTDVRERMLYKSADTTRLIDRLIQKELVERSQCENDRRRVDIRISEQGLHVLSELDAKIEAFALATTRFSEEEARQFNTLLDKIRESGLINSGC